MKKAVIGIFILLVMAAAAGIWLLYGNTWLNGHYLNQGRRAEEQGRIDLAVTAYERALTRIETQPSVRVTLSQLYVLSGNYSRAERVLQDGLRLQAGNPQMNTALSALFVEQNKLTDAVSLLDNVELATGNTLSRPAVPRPVLPAGKYDRQINLSFHAEDGTVIYYTLNGETPGTDGPVYTGEPVALPPGTTAVTAVAVHENGLVSSFLTGFEYTLERVDMPVDFEDAATEELTRLIISKPYGDIYSSDIWGITTFDNTDTGFIPETLGDFRQFIGLESLTLTGDDIPFDFRPLMSLEALSQVTLINCHIDIRELDVLLQLPALTELSLPRNRLTSLSAIAGRTQLVKLDVSQNNLNDILPLSGLVSLRELDISENPLLADLTPLEPLVQLQILNVSGCSLSALTPLKELTRLTVLDISHNNIWDLGALAEHNDLEVLKANHNSIDTLEPLSGLASLQELDISMNSITTLRPLLQCAALRTVNAFGNRLTDAAGAFDTAHFTVIRS
jgi:Leucine-rich repeat (LRR) protein